MNHVELVHQTAARTGLTKADTDATLRAALEVAAEELRAGSREVTLLKVGKLTVVEKSARTGRNPRTGAPVGIPARRAVKFKSSAGLVL